MAKKEAVKVEEINEAPAKKTPAPVKTEAPGNNEKFTTEEVDFNAKHPELRGIELSKHDRNEIKKIDQKEEYYQKPLHFHFFSALMNFIVFLVAVAGFVFAGLYLVEKDDASNTVKLLTGIIMIITFCVLIGEFQLGWRRVFHIGKYERIRKAQEKNAEKFEHYKNAHTPNAVKEANN